MIFGSLAYVSRGLRWIILIEAIGDVPTKMNSISSVSVGYLTNLFIPRAGEITRCTSLNRTEKIPVDKLFGTILIERVIDFAFLIFLILLTVILKFGDIKSSYHHYQNLPATNSTLKWIFLAILILIPTILFLFRNQIIKTKFYIKIKHFFEGIKEGFRSIQKMRRKSVFWFHTFSIWIMYFLMTYVCFYCIDETSNLTISDGLFLLVLGGIGMVVPTPGGIGSYHVLVMIGIVSLGVEGEIILDPYDKYNPAMLFPFVVHTAQTFLAIIMGSLGLLILFLYKKKMNE